jgi:hypothetical protein
MRDDSSCRQITGVADPAAIVGPSLGPPTHGTRVVKPRRSCRPRQLASCIGFLWERHGGIGAPGEPPAVAGTRCVPATDDRAAGVCQRPAVCGCQGAVALTTSQKPQLCWRSMILAGVIALSPAGTSDITRSWAAV